MSNLKKLLVLLLGCWSGMTGAAYAQEKISGRVLDAFVNKPLQGVTVQAGDEKSQTDAQGRFSLEVKDGEEVLVQQTGYEPQRFSTMGWKGERTIGLMPSSTATLGEVVVQGYSEDQKLLETGGNLSLLTQGDLGRGNKVSLAPLLNTVPGVMVNQPDYGSDSRISIRGEGLRSTYGTRDIAIYLDNIPLNEADGFSRIEGLDVFTLGKAEVIKGPASSIYGAGLGGVLNFQTIRPESGETLLESSNLLGSYGLFRTSGSLKADLGDAGVQVTYGRQWFSGYMGNTDDSRSFATALGTFHPNANDDLTVLANQSHEVNHFNTFETLDQFHNNPTLAGDPYGYEQYQVNRTQTWTRFGLSNTFRFSDQWENTTSLYSSSFILSHPYAPYSPYYPTFLKEQMQSVGGRSEITFKPTLGEVETRLTGGGEIADQDSLLNYYDSEPGGNVGPQDAVYENLTKHLNLFFEGQVILEGKTFLSAGLDYNNTVYGQYNYYNYGGATNPYSEIDFTPTTTFRVSLSHVFDEGFSVYGDISQGFSPPIIDESSNPAGGLLTGLQPELATQFEVGTRGHLLDKRLGYDLTLFDMDVSQELIAQYTPFGAQYFVNAGKTNHKGLELSASYQLADGKDGFFTSVKPWVSGTLQNFVFVEYANNLSGTLTDYSGKQETGTPSYQGNLGMDIETEPGLYLHGTFQFLDRYPLTDDNTVWNNAYGLLGAKIGFKRVFAKALTVDAFVGGDNLANSVYAGYTQLNAYYTLPDKSDGQYYQPGLPANYYGGLNVGWLF